MPLASPRGVSVLQAGMPFAWPICWKPGRRQSTLRSAGLPEAELAARKAFSDWPAPWTASQRGWVVTVLEVVPLSVPLRSIEATSRQVAGALKLQRLPRSTTRRYS